MDELDCDKTESMFLKLFSDDDDDTELHVWIQVGSLRELGVAMALMLMV